MVLASLAAFGLWFWMLAAIVFVAAVATVENEQFKVTTPVVIIGVAGLIWLSHSNVLSWVKLHYITLILALVAYLVIGVIYGFVRYVFYVHKIADLLAKWVNDKGYTIAALTQTQASDFARMANVRHFPLRVADSKGRIIFWSIYWPFSAPWTMINEPVKRFFSFAYGRMAGLMQGVANRAFKNVTIVADPVPVPKGLSGDRVQLNG